MIASKKGLQSGEKTLNYSEKILHLLGAVTKKPLSRLLFFLYNIYFCYMVQIASNMHFLEVQYIQPTVSCDKYLKLISRLSSVDFVGPIIRCFNLRVLGSSWAAVSLKKGGPFLQDTLERVLEVLIMWHILLISLLSICKLGYGFPIKETLQISLLNDWKGSCCGTPYWRIFRREFLTKQCLLIACDLQTSF